MPIIRLSKKKMMDRIKHDLKDGVINLEGINDSEVELIPDKYLKRLSISVELISVISDMLHDMEYEQ